MQVFIHSLTNSSLKQYFVALFPNFTVTSGHCPSVIHRRICKTRQARIIRGLGLIRRQIVPILLPISCPVNHQAKIELQKPHSYTLEKPAKGTAMCNCSEWR
jgi:hypothetical protein